MIFTGASDYRSVLEQYANPAVLPPEIYPDQGRGEVAVDMTYNFKGGLIPQDENETEAHSFEK